MERTLPGSPPATAAIPRDSSSATRCGESHRAIELKDRYGIRVINLSLGRPVYESHEIDPLCLAVKAAWQAGIVVAAAGNNGRDNSFGNSGYGTINSPANSPYVITVGAMNTMTTRHEHHDNNITR
jgi:serine protease AprX